LLTVNTGATQALHSLADNLTFVAVAQPDKVAVIVGNESLGILIILSPAVTVPAVDVTTTLDEDLVKNAVYVFTPEVLHLVPPNEISGLSHAFPVQEAGLLIVIFATHVPLTAVIVTLDPIVRPVILLPTTVPEDANIVAPVVSTKLNSHSVPLQTPLPIEIFGVTQDEVFGQSKLGVVTFETVEHPVTFEAVIVTVEFLGILITLLPLTVPADACTPLLAFVVNVIS
jgi:hypothetical protein